MSALVNIRPRPSSAHQWVGGGCTGSPSWKAQWPRESGAPAVEGTRLHDVARDVAVGVTAIASVKVEDREIIQPYTDDVAAAVAAAPPSAQLFIEQPLQWDEDLRFTGTPDARLMNPVQKHVIIWDLKTGWGVVEAESNWQLLCYAVMCVPEGWSVELRVTQAKPWHPHGITRAWHVSPRALDHYRKRIRNAVREVFGKTAKLITGPHCKYCDAIHACPAARTMTMHAAQWAVRTPHDLPVEHMARELQHMRDAKDMLTNRISGLEETILAALKSGTPVPYVTQETASGGRVSWADEAAAVAGIHMATGVDHSRATLPTPKQLIKLGLSPQLVHHFTTQKAGKRKLTIDLDGAQIKNAFGDEPPDLTHIKQARLTP